MSDDTDVDMGASGTTAPAPIECNTLEALFAHHGGAVLPSDLEAVPDASSGVTRYFSSETMTGVLPEEGEPDLARAANMVKAIRAQARGVAVSHIPDTAYAIMPVEHAYRLATHPAQVDLYNIGQVPGAENMERAKGLIALGLDALARAAVNPKEQANVALLPEFARSMLTAPVSEQTSLTQRVSQTMDRNTRVWADLSAALDVLAAPQGTPEHRTLMSLSSKVRILLTGRLEALKLRAEQICAGSHRCPSRRTGHGSGCDRTASRLP